MSLDVSFGSVKRKCALYFNHRSRQHIQTLRCDLMARIRKVTKLAERIERDALICADRAEFLVRSCRKCKNVQALQECMKENSDSATKILEDGSKCAEDSLKEIVAYKQNIIKYYKAVSAEAIKTYSKENAMFTKYLDDCICALTKKRK
ncbi:uncharacterized protein LOC143360149 [Halictus rubicundus]|uniref:uncharacterized protein LOC143360149 n=1 Tax=Halictus rubicundus TaxID=77578 RepID=UPI00403571CC